LNTEIKIEYDNKNPNYLGFFTYADFNIHRKHARFYVSNIGNEIAFDVRGILEFVNPKIKFPIYLHWTHIPYTDTELAPANIPRKGFCILDVVFSQPEEGTDLTEDLIAQTYIGPPKDKMLDASTSATYPPELMPYHGTDSKQLIKNYSSMYEAKPEGCYVAHNNALLSPKEFSQYHVPPGEYEGIVRLTGYNIAEIALKFRLISPNYWKDLNLII
jgi:hypothetical protein